MPTTTAARQQEGHKKPWNINPHKAIYISIFFNSPNVDLFANANLTVFSEFSLFARWTFPKYVHL